VQWRGEAVNDNKNNTKERKKTHARTERNKNTRWK
jgi:hypothetical protein